MDEDSLWSSVARQELCDRVSELSASCLEDVVRIVLGPKHDRTEVTLDFARLTDEVCDEIETYLSGRVTTARQTPPPARKTLWWSALASLPALAVILVWDDDDDDAATVFWWVVSVALCARALFDALPNLKPSLVAASYAWRAAFQSQEIERLCIADTVLASPLVHRSVAAIGETLAVHELCCRLLPGERPRPMLAVIVTAQLISFWRVVSKSEVFFFAENALWACAALFGLLVHLRTPKRAAYPRRGALVLALYVIYAVACDLPLHARRAKEKTPRDVDFRTALACQTVSRATNDWRDVFATRLLDLSLMPALVVHLQPPRQPVRVIAWLGFGYAWQLAGYVRVGAHFAVARALGIPTLLKINNAWKLVPGYPWHKPHDAFVCAYDKEALRAAPPWHRVAIGFAGPYLHLAYLLLLGVFFPTVAADLGGWKTYALGVGLFFLAFLVWTALHFYDDDDGFYSGKFALFTAYPVVGPDDDPHCT